MSKKLNRVRQGGTITGYSGTVLTHNLAATQTKWTQCQITNIASVPSPVDSPFDVDNPQSFIVGAAGGIANSTGWGNCDQWTINETKVLQNVLLSDSASSAQGARFSWPGCAHRWLSRGQRSYRPIHW